MALIADFLLLAASACACFYCWMLSRRLQKLKSTRRGIAASVASLSKSVDEAKKAIAHSHVAAEESVAKLSPLVAEAKELTIELKKMAKVLNEAQFAPVPEAPQPEVRQKKENSDDQVDQSVSAEMQSSEAEDITETVVEEPLEDKKENPSSDKPSPNKSKDDFEHADGEENADFEIEWKSDEESAPAAEDLSDVETVVLDDTEDDEDLVEQRANQSSYDGAIIDEPQSSAERDIISLV
ncbi:MAG: DUF6468 domain-containing protein [Pseudomonadota bacterium]